MARSRLAALVSVPVAAVVAAGVALDGAASSSENAQCSQVVSVQPSSAYQLSPLDFTKIFTAYPG